MNKEKQIEEMAKDLENHTCMSQFQAEIASRMLYIKGYRKASDVALDSVDDFQSRIRRIFCTMCNDNDYNTLSLIEIDSAIEHLFDMFVAELKKKYTEITEGGK